MRRIRDHVPYSVGDKMMLGNAGAGWMVEGSPPRLTRDYNDLVEAYNLRPPRRFEMQMKPDRRLPLDIYSYLGLYPPCLLR